MPTPSQHRSWAAQHKNGVSVRTIAKRAGVSPSTVSRTLKNPPPPIIHRASADRVAHVHDLHSHLLALCNGELSLDNQRMLIDVIRPLSMTHTDMAAKDVTRVLHEVKTQLLKALGFPLS